MANARVAPCPAVATAVQVAPESDCAIAQNAVHRRIGRLTDMFIDTPDDVGLLTVTAPHVGAAGSDHLGGSHRHSMHALDAIPRSTLGGGPRDGCGVAPASTSCAGHRRMADSALGTVVEAGAPTNVPRLDVVVDRTTGDQVVEEQIDLSWQGSKLGLATTEAAAACLQGGPQQPQ